MRKFILYPKDEGPEFFKTCKQALKKFIVNKYSQPILTKHFLNTKTYYSIDYQYFAHISNIIILHSEQQTRIFLIWRINKKLDAILSQQ